MRLRKSRLGWALVVAVAISLLTAYIVLAAEPFAPPTYYAVNPPASPAGTNAASAKGIAIGDYNRDGKNDLAIIDGETHNFAGCPGCGRVLIVPGHGDGTFDAAPLHTYYTSEPTTYVTAVDVNGDNKLDLLMLGSTCVGTENCVEHGWMATLTGNGDGSFKNGDGTTNSPAAPATETDVWNNGVTPMTTPHHLVAGKFHGAAGHVDVAIIGNQESSGGGDVAGRVVTLDGNGDGTFAYGQAYDIPNDGNYIAVGDLDKDGRLDLVAAAQGGSTEVDFITILWGNGTGATGDGTFDNSAVQVAPRQHRVTACVPVSAHCEPESVALGDLNGDGLLDMVVANGDQHTVTVLMANSAGGAFNGFTGGSAATSYSIPDGPNVVYLADMNLDGKLDLVVNNEDNKQAPTPAPTGTTIGGHIHVLPGKGDGTFGTDLVTLAEPRTADNDGPLHFYLGDLNGDGILDALAPLDANFVTPSPSVPPQQCTVSTATGCIAIFLSQSDLSVAKVHTGTVRAGSSVPYTVTVTNHNTFAASGNATVIDTMPAGFSYVSSSGAGWTCSASGQIVTCKHPTPVLAGQSTSFTLTLAVAVTAAGTATNRVSVSSGTPDPVVANNSGVDAASIAPPPALPAAGSGPRA